MLEKLFGNKERLSISNNMPANMYDKALFNPHMPLLKTAGNYQKKFPEGVIIHFTSGWQNQTSEDALRYAYDNGFTYFFIDMYGKVHQQFDLTRWGYHAGQSLCPVTKRTAVSTKYVGIEVACGGKLTQGKTWFGQYVMPIDINKNKTGEWQKFTPMQEIALFDLCLWLSVNGVNPDLILGHEEVTTRKDDPGGCLSCSLREFRNKVKLGVLNWKR